MFSTKDKPTSRGSLNKLPNEVRIQAAGTPRVLRTVEDALAMIATLPREIARLPRWTFAKALSQSELKNHAI
jgi:hypothetical protein